MDKQENITGLSEMLGVFDYLRSDFKDEVLKDALADSAHLFEEAIKERAPVLTGNIKSKVVTKVLKSVNNGTTKGVLVGISLEGKRGKSDDPNRSAYYALPVEKGYMAGVREVRAKADTFRILTTKSGRNYTRGSAARNAQYSNGSVYVPPNPFVQPAFDAVAPKVGAVFAKSFNDGVKRLSSRNLKKWGSS